jgi:signal transduction histidine kinase/CheY-like chemotaxis protein
VDILTSPAPSVPRAAIRRQRIVRTRRQYNQWVNDETLEDYALRFTARKARIWSPWWVANTALGSIAFLACEAIGATITISYGFHDSVLALMISALVFIGAGLPICYYGARYGVDMDLLTRGAGFGYLGSTITSAVYASFTYILFAIEAVILSAALKICFGIPLPIGHLISALVVLPIAAYGFRRISQWQNWTQPIWLVLQCAPFVYLALRGPEAVALWTGYDAGTGGGSLLSFAAALAILLSLLPQIGEQVDYLRFLPDRERTGATRWWLALLLTGPGWIVLGGVKILIGSMLAVLALRAGATPAQAADPAALYFGLFGALFDSPIAAMVLTALFVAVCQIKINVTNAYAGSIASSNFFSRLTHRHPGRVVWLVFNILIVLMLMENGIQTVVERVLALYSNFAVAWFGAVTADLVVSKPLGLSPKGIEFKRAHLYDINPVGVGAMLLSLVGSTLCLAGLFGPLMQAFAPVIGLALSFVAAPLIAWGTRGRYYIARAPMIAHDHGELGCTVCENRFEPSDMAHCPVYEGYICSLCCTLEARCHDACKSDARAQRPTSPHWIIGRIGGLAGTRLARVLLLFAALLTLIIAPLLLVSDAVGEGLSPLLRGVLATLTILAGFAAWFVVLARENQRAAEEESDRQTAMLIEEIEAHRQTDAALQKAKEAAEAANLAKSRYIVGVSHEIRAPLNTISGYAQLLERDPTQHVEDAVRVIRRSAAHLTNLVDGLVDISRIENGTLSIARDRVALADMLDQIADMFRLQAAAKGLMFDHERAENLPPYVFTDEKRLRQILINLVSNAIKYTPSGSVGLTVRWRNPVAEFEVWDTGIGIAQEDIERAFEPFERIRTLGGVQGVGLGLTITRLLAQIMGGDILVDSRPGAGSRFRVRLFLSEASGNEGASARSLPISGYEGPRRRIIAADDDPAHLEMLTKLLRPLGFDFATAADGNACLEEYRKEPAHLLILDIAMPERDGWSTARAIREEYGEEPAILMVSANVHDAHRRRSEDDPHDDFLSKPYELDALLDRFGTLLGIRWTAAANVPA